MKKKLDHGAFTKKNIYMKKKPYDDVQFGSEIVADTGPTELVKARTNNGILVLYADRSGRRSCQASSVWRCS